MSPKSLIDSETSLLMGYPCSMKSRSFICARVVVHNWQLAPPAPDQSAAIFPSNIDRTIPICTFWWSLRESPSIASDRCLNRWDQSWNCGYFLRYLSQQERNGTLWKRRIWPVIFPEFNTTTPIDLLWLERPGILHINLSRYSGDRPFHAEISWFSSIRRFVAPSYELMVSFMIDQRFSIGFKSDKLGG